MFNNLYRPVSSGATALAIALLLCVVISHGTAQTALADTTGTCSISPSTLPAGTVGTAYSTTLEASGGTEPYTWTVIGGALPAGLTLGSATGVISGTPSAAGTHSFIVRVDDSAQHYCTMSISISVNPSATASEAETISTLMISNADSLVLSNNILSAAKELSSSDGRVRLSLAAGTTINMQGQTQLGVATESNPPAATDNSTLIRAYSFIPSGATFSPAVTMTLKYEKTSLPAGAAESDLYIAFWNGTAWEKITSSVDTGTQEVSTLVGHFTIFAIRYFPLATTTTTTTTITAMPVTVSANILGAISSFSASGGKLPSSVSLSSSDGKMSISLADNTTVGLPAGSQQITVFQLATMPAPPANSKVIEAYAFGPDNTTFSPAATVTLKYDQASLPADVPESGLYMALLQDSNWTEVPSSVDTQAKTVTAQVSHFSTYALLGRVTAAVTTPAAPAIPATTPSTPPAFNTSDLSVSPGSAKAGQAVTVSVRVVNGSSAEARKTVVLKINDQVESQKDVNLVPGKSQVVSFNVVKTEPGRYSVSIDGQSAEFSVTAAAGGGAPSGMAIPILAVIIAGGLLIIVLVIVLLMRQRSSGY